MMLYFLLPIVGWMALLLGFKRGVLYLTSRYTLAGRNLAGLRANPIAKRISISAALVIPCSLLLAALTADVVDDLGLLAICSKVAGCFLWEGIGWGFYASLLVSLLLHQGKLRNMLVGLNYVIFSWMSLAVSFGGPPLFNVVYLLKVLLPIIPMDWLVSLALMIGSCLI